MSFALQTRSITTAQADFTGILAYACTIPGTVLCFLVLVAYGVMACLPESRPHLDRVTFRLLTYAMVFNVLYGIAFSVTAAQVGPGPLCTFGAFAVNFTLFFSTIFTFCIALNLQLVLVHNVNGKMMEKYYVIGTTIMSLGLTVPAYGLHQFGWQVDNSTCWFRNPNHNVRLRWLIGSQSFWTLLLATGETVCSMVVLSYMVRYEIKSKSLRTRFSTTLNTRSSSRRSTFEQASQYRNVIMRIALYPIVSLMVNYSTATLDIYTTIHGLQTQLDFRLLVLDLCLYGFRTAAYGILAMGDPSFLRALRAVHGSRSIRSQGSSALENTFPSYLSTSAASRSTTAGQLTINIELERVAHSDVDSHDKPEFDKQYIQGDNVDTQPRADGVRILMPPTTDAGRDVVRRFDSKLDLEDEFARNFRRQL